MTKLSILATFCIIFCYASLPQASGDYESDFFGPKLVIRAPRSITNIFRRFFGGRRKQTGFQGTAQAQQPYDISASSYYPNYLQSPFHGLPYSSSGFGGLGGFSYPFTSSFSSYPGLDSYGSLAQAASLYPSFSSYPSGLSSGLTSGSLDYQSYLDSLIGSSGRPSSSSSTGSSSSSASPSSSSSSASSATTSSGGSDQETSSSTLSVKGEYPPGLSLKSLYSSFPLAFAPDTALDAFGLHSPFARKHSVKRMSNEKGHISHQLQKILNQRHQQGMKQKEKYYKEQDQIRNMLMNPQEYIAHIIQQELAAQQAQLRNGPQPTAAESAAAAGPSSEATSPQGSQTSTSPNQQSYYFGGSQSSQASGNKSRQASNYGISKKSSNTSVQSTHDRS